MELYNKEFVYFDWDDKLEGKRGFFGDSINHLKLNVKDNRTMFYGEICHNVNTNTDYPFGFIDGYGSSHCFRFCYYDPYYEFRKAYIEGKQLQYKDLGGDWIDVTGAPCFTTDTYRIKPEWYIILDDYGLSRINSKKDGDVLFEGTEEECIEQMEKYKPFEKIMLAHKQGKIVQYKENNEWVDWMLDTIPQRGALVAWKEWRIKDECEEAVESAPFDSVQELIDAWDEKYPQNKNRPKGAMPLIWIKTKQKNRVYLITDFLFEQMYGCNVGTETDNLSLKELFENYTFADGTVIGKVKE